MMERTGIVTKTLLYPHLQSIQCLAIVHLLHSFLMIEDCVEVATHLSRSATPTEHLRVWLNYLSRVLKARIA